MIIIDIKRRGVVRNEAKRWAAILGAVAMLIGVGCAPEVGSEAWCTKMKEKPKGDWSTNETSDYAKSCLFK